MRKSIYLLLSICILIVVCSLALFACEEDEQKTEPIYWKAQFQDLDGNIIYETTVEDGGEVNFDGEYPTKPATAKYTYEFLRWDSNLYNIHKDIVFTPVFTETQNQVLVTYLREDDSTFATEQVGYEDGAQLTSYPYKESTVDKNYIFVGWDKDLTCVTEPIITKPTYIATDRYYKVYFKDEDGKTLETKSVKYNASVEYTGTTPVKATDGHYKYSFDSWNKSLEHITEDTVFSPTFSHEDNLDYLTFTLSNDRTYYSASLKSGAKTYDDCYVPGTYENLPVKYVGGLATYSSHIKNYFLGEGIEVISSSAFSSGEMESFTCPSTLKTIGQYAFSSCTSLKNVTLNDGLETIVANAFQNCSRLKEIDIPDTVTSIGQYVFKNTAIESLVIPSSVTTLYSYSFAEMKSLKAAVVNANITTLPASLFSEDSWLNSLTLNDNIETLQAYFISNCGSLLALDLPSNLKTIQTNAFTRAYVEVVDIPNGVTTIGQQAFYQSHIKEVHIPDTVTSVGQNTFDGSEYLTTVVYNPNLSYVPAYAFSGCSRLVNIELGENINTIGDYAFSRCASLKNIVIPDNITKINQYAFKNCTNLFDVVLSKNLTNIGNYAFKESTKAWFYFKAASTTGISFGTDWAGSTFQYVYSETAAEGAWHYKDDGTIEVWSVS